MYCCIHARVNRLNPFRTHQLDRIIQVQDDFSPSSSPCTSSCRFQARIMDLFEILFSYLSHASNNIIYEDSSIFRFCIFILFREYLYLSGTSINIRFLFRFTDLGAFYQNMTWGRTSGSTNCRDETRSVARNIFMLIT